MPSRLQSYGSGTLLERLIGSSTPLEMHNAGADAANTADAGVALVGVKWGGHSHAARAARRVVYAA